MVVLLCVAVMVVWLCIGVVVLCVCVWCHRCVMSLRMLVRAVWWVYALGVVVLLLVAAGVGMW